MWARQRGLNLLWSLLPLVPAGWLIWTQLRSGDPRQSLQVTFILGVLAWIGALAIKTWQAR